MAMKGLTKCAVHDCNSKIHGPNNLCDAHRLPGLIYQARDRKDVHTMVVTAWYAERGDECGIIFLNDCALGAYFGGGAGFEPLGRDERPVHSGGRRSCLGNRVGSRCGVPPRCD